MRTYSGLARALAEPSSRRIESNAEARHNATRKDNAWAARSLRSATPRVLSRPIRMRYLARLLNAQMRVCRFVATRD